MVRHLQQRRRKCSNQIRMRQSTLYRPYAILQPRAHPCSSKYSVMSSHFLITEALRIPLILQWAASREGHSHSA